MEIFKKEDLKNFNDFNTLIDDIYNRKVELEEKKRIEDLKAKGIITDACLICSKSIKAEITEVLRENGIKIAIICNPYVEKDKLYMVTDKDLVEAIKKAVNFDYE